MTTRFLIGDSKLKPRPGQSEESRDLVKLNQIVELVLSRAGAVGALSVKLPFLGTIDGTQRAVESFRREITIRKDYWLQVFREVKVIMGLDPD